MRLNSWRASVPTSLKTIYWHLVSSYYRLEHGVDDPKHAVEIRFWKRKWEREGRSLGKGHYERNMLAMAEESDQSFLKGKIVADFGCGPRGSLCWATEAKARIGIDVLVMAFQQLGISEHNMDYVCSTETQIPIPSGHVDVLFTLNALDHVADLSTMCKELIRILAKGGSFIASMNLDGEGSLAEPQKLTEDLVERYLLRYLNVRSYRIKPRGEDSHPYSYFFTEALPLREGPNVLWMRATKP